MIAATSRCAVCRAIRYLFTVGAFAIAAATVTVRHTHGRILGLLADAVEASVLLAVARAILYRFRLSAYAVAATIGGAVLGTGSWILRRAANAVAAAV